MTMETAAPFETTIPVELPPGANACKYQGAQTVANFGDVERELHAALRDCVVIQENWRERLRVTGGDAARWLNGMLTNTSALEDGAGNYSFLLSPQGRIQGDVSLFRQGAEYVLETSAVQRQKVSEWLEQYIIMDDVELSPASTLTATIAVAGPRAPELLARMDAALADIPPMVLREAQVGGVALLVVKDDGDCVPCFHLWHDAAQSRELWDVLMDAGAVRAGADAAEYLRIVGGVPLFGVDIGERDLAQETSQTRALHFSKGCYIGQEIVERIRSRGQVHRGWRGFTAETALRAGADIMAPDRAIGKMTSVAALPLANGHKFAGLGIVRLQPLEEHVALTVDGCAVEPAMLPFALSSEAT
jgi:folate-binding protein YgfZ